MIFGRAIFGIIALLPYAAASYTLASASVHIGVGWRKLMVVLAMSFRGVGFPSLEVLFWRHNFKVCWVHTVTNAAKMIKLRFSNWNISNQKLIGNSVSIDRALPQSKYSISVMNFSSLPEPTFGRLTDVNLRPKSSSDFRA